MGVSFNLLVFRINQRHIYHTIDLILRPLRIRIWGGGVTIDLVFVYATIIVQNAVV